MPDIWVILVGAMLAVGIFFAGIGVLGILRFPGFYARAQASTCITTLGTMGAVAAGIIYCISSGLEPIWYVKLILICGMIMISGAISGHSLVKGTYKRGHRPHGEGFLRDDYEEDGFDEN